MVFWCLIEEVSTVYTELDSHDENYTILIEGRRYFNCTRLTGERRRKTDLWGKLLARTDKMEFSTRVVEFAVTN
jgi:hypothetical protein